MNAHSRRSFGCGCVVDGKILCCSTPVKKFFFSGETSSTSTLHCSLGTLLRCFRVYMLWICMFTILDEKIFILSLKWSKKKSYQLQKPRFFSFVEISAISIRAYHRIRNGIESSKKKMMMRERLNNIPRLGFDDFSTWRSHSEEDCILLFRCFYWNWKLNIEIILNSLRCCSSEMGAKWMWSISSGF